MNGFNSELLPDESSIPPNWDEFVDAVNRTDRFIQLNGVWRTDFSAPREAPPTGPPTFKFMGWRVYRPPRPDGS